MGFSRNRCFLEQNEKSPVGDGGPAITEENAEEIMEALWLLEVESEWVLGSGPRYCNSIPEFKLKAV